MPYRFNAFSGTLDFYLTPSGGSGVLGPDVSTDNAISIWDGITGDKLSNSLAIIQDGGAIESSGFITNRIVDEIITVKSNFSMISANIEIENGEIIIESDGELIII